MSVPSVPPPPPVPPVSRLPQAPPPPRHLPRRADCPWCGSPRLRGPRAGYDACRDCRHAFRNPARPDGPPPASPLRAGVRRGHRRAARALFRHSPGPESWLDVGTGDGAFPAAARELFPYTSFDGTDPGHRVLRAHAAEHVEEAYVGRLTDPHLAARLRARYDVVSLLRHLADAADPRAELRAAVDALRPGGHLLVEVLDPRRPLAPPPEGLRAELRDRGCAVLTGERSRRVVARKGASAA
ncbi:class I SAM-dependent methyltransferase [Streptomyces sp. SHP 1-2]|uniref:class I SAM-dependent methyltransferase n=1 Tax=Streptomyces sp. SHP 1-2 TaxID=2769489 RepID=UPI0022371639|nr:class I SAM-dependent methyltransferase [Streptomyces sp. SHP 1-2]MCW5249225.1 methyltransferase domain-containing protein [Streptomyces sp. SHP 1-2]